MTEPTVDRPIKEMTDRELAEETLYWLRTAGKAFAEIQNGGIGAMMGQMMKGMVGRK